MLYLIPIFPIGIYINNTMIWYMLKYGVLKETDHRSWGKEMFLTIVVRGYRYTR